MTWEILIPLIAVVLSLLSIGIELLMHDRDKGKEIEFAIKRKQRKIKELQKAQDTKAMMQANKELMSLMGQNFKLRMKTMFISFPMFIIIFFFLNGALSLAPLEAGATSEVGLNIRNVDSMSHDVTVELVSDGISVIDENVQTLELDDKGDQGDTKNVWWTVTASEGDKTYTIKINSGNMTDEKTYGVSFVPPGSITADFERSPREEALNGVLEVEPQYKAVEINIFGMTVGWFIYYLITYFAIAIAISPLKNKILWGHWKGIKHLEKLDREKNEAAEE
jgi:hypothetical protein